MAETIKDERGRVLAHLKEEGSSLRLLDATWHTLGWYHRTRNITVDANHRPIGPGDQLGRLIPRR